MARIRTADIWCDPSCQYTWLTSRWLQEHGHEALGRFSAALWAGDERGEQDWIGDKETAVRSPTRHAGTKPTCYSEEPRWSHPVVAFRRHDQSPVRSGTAPTSSFTGLESCSTSSGSAWTAAVVFHSRTVWASGVHCSISAEAWKARTKSATN